jgi:hypothetical protein
VLLLGVSTLRKLASQSKQRIPVEVHAGVVGGAPASRCPRVEPFLPAVYAGSFRAIGRMSRKHAPCGITSS